MELMKNKKKILVLTERFYPEEFLINDLVKNWSEDFQITVLTQFPTYPFGKIYKGYKNSFYRRELGQKITIKRIFTVTGYRNNIFLKITGFFIFLFLTTSYVLLRGWRYDKVFVYHVGSLTVAIPAVILKKVYKRKFLIWTQDIWPDTIGPNGFNGIKGNVILKIVEFVVKFVFRNADKIATTSELFIPTLLKYAPNQNIVFCPNWSTISYEGDSSDKVHLSNRINFTFAGNINKWRNLSLIIECFEIFNNTKPIAQLNIIGDGSGLNEIKTLVNLRQINNIKFYGRIDSKKMKEYYNGSDILIISLANNECYNKYLPAKFSTYLSTGKPIYAILNGAVPIIMKTNFLGHSVKPNAPAEIIKGFDMLCALSEADKINISRNAREMLAKCFDKNTIILRLTKLLNEL